MRRPMVRAMPSWAILAILVAPALLRAALVAITASVVLARFSRKAVCPMRLAAKSTVLAKAPPGLRVPRWSAPIRLRLPTDRRPRQKH